MYRVGYKLIYIENGWEFEITDIDLNKVDPIQLSRHGGSWGWHDLGFIERNFKRAAIRKEHLPEWF